jgi:hypothetical protein
MSKKYYFQDAVSYQNGVPYDWDAKGETGTFFSGSVNDINHFFIYDQLLNELLKCSLRRTASDKR